jgi:competence protein ComEA
VPEITRSQLVVYGSIALIVAILGARYLEGARAASTPTSRPGATTQAPGGGGSPDAAAGGAQVIPPRDASAGVLVHVAGAVRHPGVYRLKGDARVRDAVRRAGGAARGADPDAVNLAAKLADGQQVLIPRRAAAPGTVATPPGAAPAAAPGAGTAPSPPISLSSATVEQLDTLDGVGPATAQRIVAWRAEHGGFRSVDDLGEVPGIGPKRMAALRPHLQP